MTFIERQILYLNINNFQFKILYLKTLNVITLFWYNRITFALCKSLLAKTQGLFISFGKNDHSPVAVN